jgi:Xaa-Pro aminopeptidase
MNHTRRIGSVRRRLAAVKLSALLVTNRPDLRYLSGFTGSSAALAVTRRAARLFTDGRYTAQAAEEVKAAKVEIVAGNPAVAAVQWMAVQPGVDSIGFDSTVTTVAALNGLKAELPSRLRRSLLTPLDEAIVEPLRQLKDSDELAILSEAALIGCELFEEILTEISPGMSEIELAAELEFRARRKGAEGMSFDTIVASGARSALPHGRATAAKLPQKGFLTLDFGVLWKGYCSDMTRTVHIGSPGSREREVYQAVLEAEEAAIEAVEAGVECGTVDEAARGILRAQGLAEAFTHSTGHGVGLEIHEGPRVGAKQKTRLAPGMVITIEPGVYLAGEYGIRIEDMVVVGRGGRQILTPAPKALIEL